MTVFLRRVHRSCDCFAVRVYSLCDSFLFLFRVWLFVGVQGLWCMIHFTVLGLGFGVWVGVMVWVLGNGVWDVRGLGCRMFGVWGVGCLGWGV